MEPRRFRVFLVLSPCCLLLVQVFVQILIAIFTEQASKFTISYNDYMFIVVLVDSSKYNCIFTVVEISGC